MASVENPLLSDALPIPFDRIEADHVCPGVRAILWEAQAAIEVVATNAEAPTWANTIEALDDLTERVRRLTGPVGHLLSVAETPELREAYNEVLPEMSDFWSRLTLHEGLWDRLKSYEASTESQALRGIRLRHRETVLRDFRRAGADLPDGEKERLAEIRVELSQLQQKFSENVLDATNSYKLLVTDEKRLEGIPHIDREQARKKASEAGEDGFLLTLDYPSFEPVIKYATDQTLREELFNAFVGRCHDGEYQNRDNIRRILQLRRSLAEILGYAHFPDYRLVDHMAKDGAAALDFVSQLTERARVYWQRDWEDLVRHGAELGLEWLEPWDVAFVAESLRKKRYDIDDEVIRPYFPMKRVISGLFEFVERVFGLTVTERDISEKWHEDVRHYDLVDLDGVHLGSFYADWHPRPEKRQGAWMNHLATGGPSEDGGFVPHIGIIAGNLTPPKGDLPALLTHREVETVFHEFGHLLHHLTSRVPIAPMAGINVAWDFVELPSQIMENWTWEKEALSLFSGHHETGESLPDEIYERLTRGRRFLGGWAMMRQLSFGFTDLKLHLDFDPHSEVDVVEHALEIGGTYAPDERFRKHSNLPSFTHLFTGGYASAYYSYLWSEVLEADAFGRFREEGIFNRAVGRAYMDAILTRGDSDDPEVLFREFMGRDPDLEALLDRNLGPQPVPAQR
jgi:oligopeptidase A